MHAFGLRQPSLIGSVSRQRPNGVSRVHSSGLTDCGARGADGRAPRSAAPGPLLHRQALVRGARDALGLPVVSTPRPLARAESLRAKSHTALRAKGRGSWCQEPRLFAYTAWLFIARPAGAVSSRHALSDQRSDLASCNAAGRPVTRGFRAALLCCSAVSASSERSHTRRRLNEPGLSRAVRVGWRLQAEHVDEQDSAWSRKSSLRPRTLACKALQRAVRPGCLDVQVRDGSELTPCTELLS